jgi:cullin-associated NEDD8-dissociated protein 1
VLRCPTEITPFLSAIVQAGNQFIKHDPVRRLVSLFSTSGVLTHFHRTTLTRTKMRTWRTQMAMETRMQNWTSECLTPFLYPFPQIVFPRYSDDEDTSYKIRRSATKLLAAVVGTRPELLISLYKDVSPVLISRFGDREETVRLEVWATYVILLNQTSVYGGLPQAKSLDTTRGKKRDNEGMDVEDSAETPYALLRRQVPALSKALLKQLKSPKTTPATLQAGYALLYALLNVLPGSLAGQVDAISDTSKSILSQSPSTSTSTLHLTCLSFWAVFFGTHSPTVFSDSLPILIPVLLKSLKERHPRVASETFRVFSALLTAMKPVKGASWVDQLYDETLQKLTSHDTDAEVRGCAEDTVADLWICATEVLRGKNGKEWEAICRTTGKTEGAVKVVTKVAKEVTIGDQWTNGCVEWLMVLMKKSGRAGKSEIFLALQVLLKTYVYLSHLIQVDQSSLQISIRSSS